MGVVFGTLTCHGELERVVCWRLCLLAVDIQVRIGLRSDREQKERERREYLWKKIAKLKPIHQSCATCLFATSTKSMKPVIGKSRERNEH